MENLFGFQVGMWGWSHAVQMHNWLWNVSGSIWAWQMSKVDWFGSLSVAIRLTILTITICIGLLFAIRREREERSRNWFYMLLRGLFTTVFWLPLIILTLDLGVFMMAATIIYSLDLMLVSFSWIAAFYVILFEWPMRALGIF